VEVSRYRPGSLVWAWVLVTLLLVVVAAAFETSSWVRGVGACAVTAGVSYVVQRFWPRRSLLKRLADAQPLPVGAVDVSDSQRDAFLFGRDLFAVLVGTAAVQALLFRDGAATVIAAGAGVAAGLAIGAARDSRIIRRWEAENGRLYTGRQSDVERKRRLYVEDPAAAPLDAS
jgi:hypothetical protein